MSNVISYQTYIYIYIKINNVNDFDVLFNIFLVQINLCINCIWSILTLGHSLRHFMKFSFHRLPENTVSQKLMTIIL